MKVRICVAYTAYDEYTFDVPEEELAPLQQLIEECGGDLGLTQVRQWAEQQVGMGEEPPREGMVETHDDENRYDDPELALVDLLDERGAVADTLYER